MSSDKAQGPTYDFGPFIPTEPITEIIFLSSITACNNLLLRICHKSVMKIFVKVAFLSLFFLVFQLIKNIILFIG